MNEEMKIIVCPVCGERIKFIKQSPDVCPVCENIIPENAEVTVENKAVGNAEDESADELTPATGNYRPNEPEAPQKPVYRPNDPSPAQQVNSIEPEPVQQTPVKQSEPPKEKEPEPIQQPEPTKNKSKAPAIIGGIAAAVVLIGGGIGAAVALGGQSGGVETSAGTEAVTVSQTEKPAETTTTKAATTTTKVTTTTTKPVTTTTKAETTTTTAATTTAETITAKAETTTTAATTKATTTTAAATKATTTTEAAASTVSAPYTYVEDMYFSDIWGQTGKYTGNLVDGLPSGEGTFTYTCNNDGISGTATYTGGWSEGKRSGTGYEEWEYEDGTIWMGGSENIIGDEMYSGQSYWITMLSNGDVYSCEGEYEQGKLVHGLEIYTFADSSGYEYEGDFDANGRFTGTGSLTITFVPGSDTLKQTYTGGFIDGVKNGNGVLTFYYASGNIGQYEGNFTDGYKNGRFHNTFTDPSGNITTADITYDYDTVV